MTFTKYCTYCLRFRSDFSTEAFKGQNKKGEIIFSEDYQRVEGLAWHRKHFVCEGCEQLLSGRAYIITKGQLLCPTCSKSKRS
ncbi:hypothetical protein MC885_017545 [Smutsia gigantea]|nr:hypothetical protein MC885_017545 [Smutsia gigantea]